MYIGSILNTREVRWVIGSRDSKGLIAYQEELFYNPGLEQCVLELITNASDHSIKYNNSANKADNVSEIRVDIGKDYVSVYNNGKGIPIEIHPDTNMYVPEMIFGNLRTSSNYDDNIKRTVGGTNGVGAKAANIFSNRFVVELQTNKQTYVQEWRNGMQSKTDPVISKKIDKGKSSADFTKITFFPNFELFGIENFTTGDTNLLIKKRVYDLAGTTHDKVSVYLDGEKIPVKNFEEYMSLFLDNNNTGTDNTYKRTVYRIGTWEVGFAACPYDQATQISFVNGIFTEDGGTHVSHVLDPVVTKITAEIQKKAKDIVIKKQYVKDNIMIFVKSSIENPIFNSQLKRKLETKVGDFGSRCDIPDEVIKKIVKLGVCDGILELAKAKQHKETMKKIDGTKGNIRLTDIKKLNDANWAGTNKSMECTLILTEGDSAKTLAVSGITSAGGHNKWGIFPLRGKFINIRGATDNQLSTNEEIIAINRILGLKPDLKDIRKLRYGKVMIFSDQDLDGFHIKGLLINYFTYNWPELVEQGLLQCMITPVIKVMKNRKVIKEFYSVNDHKIWKEKGGDMTGTYEKYYKGLGTSNSSEAKEYFSNLTKNRKKYNFNSKRDISHIVGAFDKTYADERKKWISDYLIRTSVNPIDPTNFSNPANNSLAINETINVDYFINNELVQYSVYNNVRNIPSIIDGLKPCQRKILYTCLKNDLYLNKSGKGEVKVLELSGDVMKHSAYHHGDSSLHTTIVGMAQNFVGSQYSTNNINLLLPLGAFGTRITGGKDAASARYIGTALNDITKVLFNETDNLLIDYIQEEGKTIEPYYYVPIIPMILVNGGTGIGTGWSTDIPCFNPLDIIDVIKSLLNAPEKGKIRDAGTEDAGTEDAGTEDVELPSLVPYYKNFKGSIVKVGENKWKTIGKVEIIDETTVEIVELPVGMWIENFKEYLDSLLDSKLIENVIINDDDASKTENDVCFQVSFYEPIGDKDLIKFFKLEKNINGTNMVAFDENRVIQKYESPDDILWTFYKYRLSLYEKRHKYILDDIQRRLVEVSEELRFIRMVINDEIVVFKKTKKQIADILIDYEFDSCTHTTLLNIPISKFTKDEVNNLESKLEKLKMMMEEQSRKSSKDLWIEDLDLFVNRYEHLC
jgi:DNA topoisomerase-2